MEYDSNLSHDLFAVNYNIPNSFGILNLNSSFSELNPTSFY